jgi:hypothetical protein
MAGLVLVDPVFLYSQLKTNPPVMSHVQSVPSLILRSGSAGRVRDMKVEVASNHGLDSSRGHAAAAAFCRGQANNAAAAACPRV